jgi:hypothetical protein
MGRGISILAAIAIALHTFIGCTGGVVWHGPHVHDNECGSAPSCDEQHGHGHHSHHHRHDSDHEHDPEVPSHSHVCKYHPSTLQHRPTVDLSVIRLVLNTVAWVAYVATDESFVPRPQFGWVPTGPPPSLKVTRLLI